MKPRIYPIFLPHAGCPYQCVYCNQRATTGVAPDGLQQAFHSQLAACVETVRRTGIHGEIACYGGTFTSLPPDQLIDCLKTLSAAVSEGHFSGIRFSTRPDALSAATFAVLRPFPVQTVELGAQSLCDPVLAAARRGYGAADVRVAAAQVQAHGWSLGIQLMPGLPADSRERFLDSVAGAIELKPDFVRIYPTVVLKGTLLADWTAEGRYRPLDLDEAISWCVPALEALERAAIPIARMGLHADPALEAPGTVLAGPYHPAFGYLVRCRSWRDRVDGTLRALEDPGAKRHLALHVAEAVVSEVVGHKRLNLAYWLDRWALASARVYPEHGWSKERLECALQ